MESLDYYWISNKLFWVLWFVKENDNNNFYFRLLTWRPDNGENSGSQADESGDANQVFYIIVGLYC